MTFMLPSVASRNDPIVVADDDDDVELAPTADHSPRRTSGQSPPESLTHLTPALSVTTSSGGSDVVMTGDSSNGRGIGAPSNTSHVSLSMDRYRTGIVFSADMMLHQNTNDPEHPEHPIRIWKIYTKLQEAGLLQHMKRIKIREITADEVKLVHDKGIWDGVQALADFLPDVLKMHVPMLESKSSLFVNEHSAYAARLSCGGAVEMCDAVASDRIRNGFAVIRPPGHHAEPHKSMGFCLFNNVAVATRCLLQKYPNTIRKVLILDWDVHHGNGTQRAFESDPDVLYVSLHRYDEDGSFYPGSTYGHYTSAGTGPGKGRSVNVPWPCHGMGDADYMYAFQHLVMPIAHEFAPDMVIVSAGFDAAEGDPIGHNLVSPGGFAQMTHALASLCQGKMAVILEGGYNPDAIASSALAVTDVLLSGRALPPSTTVASSLAHDTVREVCRYHQRYWKSIKVPPLLADDADSDGVDQPNSHQMSEIVAGYRNSAIKEKYELFNVPMEDTPYSDFSGQVMCSERILDGFSTILFFVHDMGNLRSERSLSGLSLTQEALRLVDASTLIMDYAQSRGYGLVDMNINREFSAVNPVLPPGIERPPLWTDVDAAELDEACQAAAFIWDNVVALAGMSQGAKKVVMVGLGSGCNVLTSLIDHRDVQRRVKAVVNVVGYDEMPHVSANADVTKKKWYFAKSHVLAPADHRHLLERGDNAPLKRFGRIHPIADVRAINILSTRIEEIKKFIDDKLQKQPQRAAAGAI